MKYELYGFRMRWGAVQNEKLKKIAAWLNNPNQYLTTVQETQECTVDPLPIESQEATELGVIWEPFIIHETQHPEGIHVQEILENGKERDERIDREEMARPGNGSHLTLAMVDAAADEGAHLVRFALPRTSSPDGKMPAYDDAASPNISEFETYLGAREVLQKQYDKNGRGDTTLLQLQRPANMSNEEWWASVLLSEQRRLELGQTSRTVELDDILPEAYSSDDDLQIVGTLKPKTTKPKARKKRGANKNGFKILGRVCTSSAHD
jgi:hypothetical protein